MDRFIEIVAFVFLWLFVMFYALSIGKSIKYGKQAHSYWKGFQMFSGLSIVAFGMFFALCWGTIAAAWFFGSGNHALLSYYVLLGIWVYSCWYGVLSLRQSSMNRYFALWGFLVASLASLGLFLPNISGSEGMAATFLVIMVWWLVFSMVAKNGKETEDHSKE